MYKPSSVYPTQLTWCLRGIVGPRFTWPDYSLIYRLLRSYPNALKISVLPDYLIELLYLPMTAYRPYNVLGMTVSDSNIWTLLILLTIRRSRYLLSFRL